MSLKLVEPTHDHERWGVAWSSDTEPRSLVRIADVVRGLVDSRNPLRLAAKQAIERLQSHGCCEFFVMVRGGSATRVGLEDLWCSYGVPESYGGAEDGKPFIGEWHVIPGNSEWAHFEPDPLRVGLAGLYACLQNSWGERAVTLTDLDAGIAGTLAMLTSDAVEAFGGASVEPETAIGLRKIPDDIAVAAAHAELKNAGNRAPTAVLAKRYGVSKDTVQRSLVRSKSAASAQSSIFKIATAKAPKRA
jgi:hypothetical protein